MLAVAAATALRLAIDPWVEGVPFLTYFLAVQVSSVLLGWRWGLFVLVSAALTANFAFQSPFMALSLGIKDQVSSFAFLLIGSLTVWASETLRRAVFNLTRAAERERELNLELAHRVNNSLAMVQGLAKQTHRVHGESGQFYEAFSGRLLALSAANKVLVSGATEFSQLPDLASAALRPFMSGSRVVLNGPRCSVPSKSSVPLVLALHELGTNATKYGALSVPTGWVELSWSLHGTRCRFYWREIDGPAVQPPRRQGLGTRLLARQAGLDEVQILFDPNGVTCEVEIEGARLVGSAED